MSQLTREKLTETLGICFAQYSYVKVDRQLIECYFQMLSDYSQEEVNSAIVACCKQHGRENHPKVGEIRAEISRVRRQDAINQNAIEQTRRLALDGPMESPERRAAVVEACRPVIDLLGTRASPEALKEAHNKMSLSLAKLRGESNGH